MIIIDDMVQGSKEWFMCKSGVASASRSAEFSSEPKLAPLPKDAKYSKEGKLHIYNYNGARFAGTNKLEIQNVVRESLPKVYGEMRWGYLAELVAQVVTGILPDDLPFKQMEWGNDHEDQARAFFELELGVDVDVPAFIYKDENMRCGISPDGLIKGKKIGLELKAPFTTKVYIDFVTREKIKQEYVDQCQYSMWVTGYEAWYFANYDPRVKNKPLHHVLIERDEEYMDKYERAEKQFTIDMDKMLDQFGVKFKSQWEGD